jgi:formylmethanofuran dehydrogenase subunit E
LAESESERQTRLKIDCEYRRKKRANETGVQQQAKKSRTSQELETNVDTNSHPSCSINDSETKNQDNYLKEFDSIKNGSIHEQFWAKANIKKFHKSVKFFISKCSICHEAWPLKSKPKSPSDYECSRCSRDKKSPKKF